METVCVTGEPGTGVQSVAVPLDPSQRDADRLNGTAYFRALSAVGVIPDAVGVAEGYSCYPRHLCEEQLPFTPHPQGMR